MGNIYADIATSFVGMLLLFFLVLYAGYILVKKEWMTADTVKRMAASIVVFMVVYFGSGLVIGWKAFDVYLRGMEYLAAVIGGGCCWIGSNKR